MGINWRLCTIIHVLGYMLIQVMRLRTGIHVRNVVMTAVENDAVEYEYSEQGLASCCRGVRSFAAGVRKVA